MEHESARDRSYRKMRQVIAMRYLHEMTLEQCGEALGLTRERVRQLEFNAFRILRRNHELMAKIKDVLNVR